MYKKKMGNVNINMCQYRVLRDVRVYITSTCQYRVIRDVRVYITLHIVPRNINFSFLFFSLFYFQPVSHKLQHACDTRLDIVIVDNSLSTCSRYKLMIVRHGHL